MTPPKNIRLDEAIVSLKMAADVDQARRMIMAGEIFVGEQRALKPSQLVPGDVKISRKYQKYVSRGGDKLESAIQQLRLESAFQNARVLDVGASTGGFTDCSLQHGAQHVVAIDVGHGHLHYKLRQDPRVDCLEKMNIRDYALLENEPFDWVVGDVSFNSIMRLISSILKSSLSKQTQFLLLIKPQFELPKDQVKTGVVKDIALVEQAVESVTLGLSEWGCRVKACVNSEVKGRSGNQEVFCFFEIEDLDLARSKVQGKD